MCVPTSGARTLSPHHCAGHSRPPGHAIVRSRLRIRQVCAVRRYPRAVPVRAPSRLARLATRMASRRSHSSQGLRYAGGGRCGCRAFYPFPSSPMWRRTAAAIATFRCRGARRSDRKAFQIGGRELLFGLGLSLMPAFSMTCDHLATSLLMRLCKSSDDMPRASMPAAFENF